MSSDDDLDTLEREPCPDGACTGILDDNGVCGTCGTQSTPPTRSERRSDDTSDDHEDEDNEGDQDEEQDEDDAPSARSKDEDDDREPCADGACTGILNAKGICGTCGKPALS